MKKTFLCLLLVSCLLCAACGAEETANIVIEDFDAGALIRRLCEHAKAGDTLFFLDYRPYETLHDDVEAAVQEALDMYYDCAHHVDTVMWETVSYKKYIHFIFKLAYTKDAAPRPQVIAYADMDLEALTHETIWSRTPSAAFLVPAAQVSPDALSARLNSQVPGFERDPYWGYLVEFCTWSFEPYTDYYAVELSFRYRAEAGAPEDVYEISEEYAAVNFFMDALRHGDERIAVYARGLSPEKLQAIFGTAQANDAADLVEEALECKSNAWGDAAQAYIAELSIRYSGSAAQREACRVQLREALDSVTAEITALGPLSQRETYLAVCKAIAGRCAYDEAAAKATQENALTPEMRFSRTAYGALVEGKTVCTGYAMALKAVCDRLGLPCWVMLGEFDGTGHAWNAVLLDGEIRYIDLTFYDTDGRAKHLLRTPADFQKDKYALDKDYILPDWYRAALPDTDLPESILPDAA